MNKNSKTIIFGSSGLLGSAIHRGLGSQGYNNILLPSSSEVNLLDKNSLNSYVKKTKPKYMFMVAGLVGGIVGNNSRPADFLYANSMMILNVLDALKNNSPLTKLLYTGSTCIYPKENPQPINENRFMCGPLEKTNEGYAVAKGLGVVACQSYRRQYELDAICAMPTNLYGLNDNYDLEGGHMIPSLIKKFLMAKNNDSAITLWGSGTPRREALFSDDCADALIHLMKNYSDEKIVNIGTGFDYSIKDFEEILSNKLNFKPEIHWDSSKPDGTFEKRTDITRLKNIYPEFNPRSFKEGLSVLLDSKKELEKILK